ncbi:hypothetical protein F1880_000658 [Penicillium rolfsii]|nr:hypothetical protein F1880_000658 [Penicillium rolfsii]
MDLRELSVSISHEEAAKLPIPLLTAWEANIDSGFLKPGVRVLATGATSAVGIFGVQIATQLAVAHVIALVSSRNREHLRWLGANEVLDYNTPNWESLTKKVDLVFDKVVDDVLYKS